MSHSIDETYDEYEETRLTAVTEHTCAACHEPILVGHRYYEIMWDFQGEQETCDRCLRCQAIHEHLRTLRYNMWPDETLDCGEEYEEHWGKEPPPEIAELAFKSGADLQEQSAEKVRST